MSAIKSRIGSAAEKIVRRTRIAAGIWERRIAFVMNQLISMRMMLGKAHEGELGLALARFVKETFRTISAYRKLMRMANSDLGRAFIAHAILNNVDEKYRGLLLSKLISLRDRYGDEFIKGMLKILKETLPEREYSKVDKILGTRITHALVSKNAIFDPVANKLYTIDPAEGRVIVKDIDLRTREGVEELLSYGLFDKKRDLLADYAEWRLIKIIEEAEVKGLKGTALGAYVHSRILEEMRRDLDFYRAMQFYLVKHFDTLEKSKAATLGFGDILYEYVKLQKRLVAAVARAATTIPFFGAVAEAVATLGEGVAEVDEGIKKRRADNKYPTVKISLSRNDQERTFF